MWFINLLFLWLVPIALGLVVLNRIANGAPALNHNERQLLFDDTKISEVTPWLAAKFAALAVMFFAIGVAQGVIVPNLHFAWVAVISVLTGGVATLLVALWLRSGSVDPWGLSDKFRRKTSDTQGSVDEFSLR